MLSKNTLHRNILKINIYPCIYFYIYMNVFKFILRNKIYFIKIKKLYLIKNFTIYLFTNICKIIKPASAGKSPSLYGI